jgi:hypothetical protein
MFRHPQGALLGSSDRSLEYAGGRVYFSTKNWDKIRAQQYHGAQERNSGLLISSSTYEKAYLQNGHSIIIGTS